VLIKKIGLPACLKALKTEAALDLNSESVFELEGMRPDSIKGLLSFKNAFCTSSNKSAALSKFSSSSMLASFVFACAVHVAASLIAAVACTTETNRYAAIV
jgi:hypothetical protein